MTVQDHILADALAFTMRDKIAEVGRRPPTPPPATGTSVATIIPFPIQLQRRMIERELISVRDYNDVGRYKWLKSVARRHRTRLKNLGIAPDLIEVDAAALEKAFGLRGEQ